MKGILSLLGALLLLAPVVRPDEIHLKDGSKIVGTIIGFEEDSFKVKTSYGYALVRRDEVVNVIVGESPKNRPPKRRPPLKRKPRPRNRLLRLSQPRRSPPPQILRRRPRRTPLSRRQNNLPQLLPPLRRPRLHHQNPRLIQSANKWPATSTPTRPTDFACISLLTGS